MGRAPSAGKLQLATAADRAALWAALDDLRGAAALLAADLDPSRIGHDVGDGSASFARARRITTALDDLLKGRTYAQDTVRRGYPNEWISENEPALRAHRRHLIDLGGEVSLIGFDPDRHVYAYTAHSPEPKS